MQTNERYLTKRFGLVPYEKIGGSDYGIQRPHDY
jgi:hypothetical protein